MLENIFEKIKNVVSIIIEIIVEILNHAIRLMADIVQWIKNKYTELKKKAFYIITVIKLKELLGKNAQKVEGLGDALKKAKVIDVGLSKGKFSEGVVQVTVNEDTNDIETLRVIGGQGVDNDLVNAMGEDDLIKIA